ncbi:hypothetical protein BCBBV1cgp54 [Bacillus phage BCASJ1c]|uniref:54 n=1 Tax=Bacillus phage BCASJ1c TaxID=294382 RepID=Q5YA56_9CAUD|nr:hypothetical protein BCBBV1cgp54 [Bacillus phage BCASJ1c]AAU85101.1 54 [Bacillus phage BCASJ1c]
MIKIQYKHLKNTSDFLLNTITAKGKKNIHRMRVVKVLQEKNDKVGEEELELLKEYAKTDENEEFVRLPNGNLDIEDPKTFKSQQESLYDEYFMIDDKNLVPALNTVEKLVNDFDKELSGKQAEAHFILVEAFENKKEENNENGKDDE